MAADIIAAPGDPLADARTLKQVHFVMKDGKVVKSKSPQPRTATR
jgi:imidazolonepropionase-like amidohydrolase